MLLLIVGVLMFFLTFCGCVGSLRENICLLQTVRIFYVASNRLKWFELRSFNEGKCLRKLLSLFAIIIMTLRFFFYPPSQFCIFLTVIFILQLIAGILGFVFADKVMYYT